MCPQAWSYAGLFVLRTRWPQLRSLGASGAAEKLTVILISVSLDGCVSALRRLVLWVIILLRIAHLHNLRSIDNMRHDLARCTDSLPCSDGNSLCVRCCVLQVHYGGHTPIMAVEGGFQPDLSCTPCTRGVRCLPPRDARLFLHLVPSRRVFSHPPNPSRSPRLASERWLASCRSPQGVARGFRCVADSSGCVLARATLACYFAGVVSARTPSARRMPRRVRAERASDGAPRCAPFAGHLHARPCVRAGSVRAQERPARRSAALRVRAWHVVAGSVAMARRYGRVIRWVDVAWSGRLSMYVEVSEIGRDQQYDMCA